MCLILITRVEWQREEGINHIGRRLMEGQYRDRQGKEEAVFVFHQWEINGVNNCTILCAAIMAFTSFIILLRRE